jgi:hypothetical protein
LNEFSGCAPRVLKPRRVFRASVVAPAVRGCMVAVEEGFDVVGYVLDCDIVSVLTFAECVDGHCIRGYGSSCEAHVCHCLDRR